MEHDSVIYKNICNNSSIAEIFAKKKTNCTSNGVSDIITNILTRCNIIVYHTPSYLKKKHDI